jgi:hypothetical protein
LSIYEAERRNVKQDDASDMKTMEMSLNREDTSDLSWALENETEDLVHSILGSDYKTERTMQRLLQAHELLIGLIYKGT